MGPGLGAHLHDALTKSLGGKGYGLEVVLHRIPSSSSRTAAPLPIIELGVAVTSGLAILVRPERYQRRKARPRHVGIGAREDHLEATWRRMITAAVHDATAVDACNLDRADVVVAVRRRLGDHGRG